MSKALITLLEQQVSESDTSTTEVGKQRSRNHRYYSMQPLGNEQKGRSHYIDPTVFGAVEDRKSLFDETFLSSRRVVQFIGPNSMESEAKTAYAQRVLKSNDYHQHFRDGWHNALVAKKMTTWLDWRREREEVTLNFLGAPSAVVNAQLQQLGEITNVDRSELESHPIPSMGAQQYVHTGKLVVEVDRSFVAIDLVQPELVFRDSSQSYAKDAGWNGRRIDATRLEMVNRGFDAEQVEGITADHRVNSTSEDAARKAHDSSSKKRVGTGLEGNQEEVSYYCTRAWLSPEEVAGLVEADSPAIYEIYWAGQEVLKWADGTEAVRVLDEMDVYEWGEYKIAHAEHGLCTADVEAHQQKAGSGLKRGVFDNMNITNNPMWEAHTDGIKDMRDLYDGVIAGVIETESGYMPGQVRALEMPQLSPLVGLVPQMLDNDSDERSGGSTTRMNTEALTNQNAESMFDKVVARGDRRGAMAARSFANDYLIPLLQGIVRLGKKHDKSQSVLEAGGRKIPIIPAQWQGDDEMEVEVALTPSEAQGQAIKLLGMDDRLRQDPEMKLLYGIKQKHALYDTVFMLLLLLLHGHLLGLLLHLRIIR